MHGLINRSIQCFVFDTYSPDTWAKVAHTADLGFENFEAMLVYPDALTGAVLDAAAHNLGRSRDSVLEDLGTYLVSNPNLEPVRRLLRFGGSSFLEFLHSLDDLQGRGRLAVPDLDLPALELIDHTPGRFSIACHTPHRGYGHVMVGVLRAMADDYGALVMLQYQGRRQDVEMIMIELLDHRFAEGRRFDLTTRAI